MVSFSFQFAGKKITIDVKECRDVFSQARGLMFRRDSPALLFIFKRKTHQSIHSFFCKNFIALWFDGERVIDVQHIDRRRFFIYPRKSFDRLLEIPAGHWCYKKIIDDLQKI